MANDIEFLARPDGERLACRVRKGRAPAVLWLGGFRSDMEGTKAQCADAWAARTGRSFVRFDYFGHGRSSGRFEDGTISRWRDDALAVADVLCPQGVIALGSSMGGWIALLLALARPEAVKALALIAPAPDFTEKLLWAGFDADTRRLIVERGVYQQPSDYDETPVPITRALIEDGRRHLLLDSEIAFPGPVRILQGVQDASVPWSLALELMARLAAKDVHLGLDKSGDHHFSTAAGLARMVAMLDELCGLCDRGKSCA